MKMSQAKFYELSPVDSRKSFYGKAIVCIDRKGEILYSYNTPVIVRRLDGKLERLWNGWSATTGRHVKAFCGISKKEWNKMKVVKL